MQFFESITNFHLSNNSNKGFVTDCPLGQHMSRVGKEHYSMGKQDESNKGGKTMGSIQNIHPRSG